MAWGSSSLRSCTSLWERIERNELVDLYILPTKQVTFADWQRCIQALSRHDGRDRRRLVSIHASGHAIDADTLRQLSKVLYETSLQVAWDEIAMGTSTLGSDVSALLSAFRPNMQLQSLDLSFKNLHLEDLQCVLDWACTSQRLQKLNLSRNANLTKKRIKTNTNSALANDGGNGDEKILSALIDDHPFPALQEVNLSDCNLEGQVAASLVSLLTQAPNLKILQLSHNPRLGATTPGGPPSLLVSSLSALVHGKNGGGLSSTSSSLPSSSSLEQLLLSNCGLSDDNVQSMMPMICQIGTLQTLDLSQNAMTAVGAAALAEEGLVAKSSSTSPPLLCWPHLQHLNVAGNPLQGSGVQVLLQKGLVPRQEQVDNVVQLDLLDLSSTKCSVETAHVAITRLRVKQLRLFDNQLQSEGFQQLAATISNETTSSATTTTTSTLESLDLAGNGANQEAVVALLRGLLRLDNDHDDEVLVDSASIQYSLKTIIVGGNEGGPELEELVQRIKKVRPDIDIARDKLKKSRT